MSFAQSRYLSIIVLFIISFIFLREYSNRSFLDSSGPIETGLTLFSIILVLVSLNIRKKFPYLPIGKVSTWLRVHVYLAWFSFVVFFVHTGFSFPAGNLERVLTILFFLAAFSGIVGAFLSKLIPRLLTNNGGAFVFDAIPLEVRDLRKEAQTIAFETVSKTGQKTLSNFFNHRLAYYFQIQRFSWNVVFNAKYFQDALLRECDYLERYLNAEEIKLIDKWRVMIARKAQLDYHYSLLLIMRYWLFIHVPLSYGLVFIGAFHGYLAYAFTGY